MKVISSKIESERAQADNRRKIVELHETERGDVRIRYLADESVDTDAMLTKHASELAEAPDEAEVNTAIVEDKVRTYIRETDEAELKETMGFDDTEVQIAKQIYG